jgi:Zn-finger nucleic acid-binding protein
MKCPIDGETLLITQRSGVEIDYCPKCRGVWLDRGELDKLIEREGDDDDDDDDDRDYRKNRPLNNRPYETRSNEPRYERRDSDNPLDMIRDSFGNKGGSYKRDDDYRYGHKKKKKGGFLSEIFDF